MAGEGIRSSGSGVQALKIGVACLRYAMLFIQKIKVFSTPDFHELSAASMSMNTCDYHTIFIHTFFWRGHPLLFSGILEAGKHATFHLLIRRFNGGLCTPSDVP